MLKAGTRWTADDHVLLQTMHANGESTAAIALVLGRSTGAISSRLNHISDGTVPKTTEMRRVALTPRTANVNAVAASRRVARHAPPLAPESRERAALISPQTPSELLAALHISTPRPPSRVSYSTVDCEKWPMVERGQFGLVYVRHKDMFAYYGDDADVGKRSSAECTDEDDNESDATFRCIVYRDGPMRGPCYDFARHDVFKPPFDGSWVVV